MVVFQSAPLLQWSSLPLDVNDLILAHLSRMELSRVRSVCRGWLATIISPQFHRLHRQLHRRAHPSLLLYNHAVKISTCKWQESDDESVDSAGASPIWPAKAPLPLWQDLSLPAPFVREWVGCHGLVCIRNHLTSDGALSVGCPFMNQWKTLPNPLQTPLLSKLWAMVPGHKFSSKLAAKSYFVILLQLNTPSLYLDVYNSETNQWTQRCLPAQSDVVKGAGKGHVVAFSSKAACIGGLAYTIHGDSRSVITYNVQRDVWKCLDAKLPAELVSQASVGQGGFIQVAPQLIEGCQGKVLVAGAASEGGDYALVVIWELDRGSKQWREMARAPLHMSLEMVEEAMESRKGAPVSIRYSGNAELVCVMASGARHAMHFDVIQEKWAWLELPSAVNCDLSLCIQP